MKVGFRCHRNKEVKQKQRNKHGKQHLTKIKTTKKRVIGETTGKIWYIFNDGFITRPYKVLS